MHTAGYHLFFSQSNWSFLPLLSFYFMLLFSLLRSLSLRGMSTATTCHQSPRSTVSLQVCVCTRMPADFYLKQTNAQTRFQGPIAMQLNRISNLSLMTVCSSSSFGPTLTHLHYHWHTLFYTGGITASSFAHSWKAFWSNKSQFTLQHLFR